MGNQTTYRATKTHNASHVRQTKQTVHYRKQQSQNKQSQKHQNNRSQRFCESHSKEKNTQNQNIRVRFVECEEDKRPLRLPTRQITQNVPLKITTYETISHKQRTRSHNDLSNSTNNNSSTRFIILLCAVIFVLSVFGILIITQLAHGVSMEEDSIASTEIKEQTETVSEGTKQNAGNMDSSAIASDISSNVADITGNAIIANSEIISSTVDSETNESNSPTKNLSVVGVEKKHNGGRPVQVDENGLVCLSDEIKYFCKYESSQNYDQGLSSGDDYHALGYYQIDNRFELKDFFKFCYDFAPDCFYMLEPFMTGNTEGIDIADEGTWDSVCWDVDAAWHEAYENSPDIFSRLQDTFIYNVSYIPAQNQLLNITGIDLNNRPDCLKGLCWGMVNLFGVGGFNHFIDDMKYDGYQLSDDMGDFEIASSICDYVANNISYYYSGQPQYHTGWINRYINEKSDCYNFLTA